jgi:L-lactate dehydrogenase
MGWVGASVAISTLHSGVAEELLLNDMRHELAEGEALDLSHGSPFLPPCQVRAASFDELAETDVIVVAAGKGGAAGGDRLELLEANVKIMRQIGAGLRGYRGCVVVVTNPVDVMTWVLTESSGLPPERVIGTGTMLDTSRLRQVLGRELKVAASSVHAYVIGEHGNSQVPLFSCAEAGQRALRSWEGWGGAALEDRIAEEVRRAAFEIIQRKGATNHAIGLVTASLLRSLLRNERRALCVSRVQAGTLGLEGVALSLPAIVGREGAAIVVEPSLDAGEREALQASAEVLRTAQGSI